MLGSQWSIILGYRRLSVEFLVEPLKPRVAQIGFTITSNIPFPCFLVLACNRQAQDCRLLTLERRSERLCQDKSSTEGEIHCKPNSFSRFILSSFLATTIPSKSQKRKTFLFRLVSSYLLSGCYLHDSTD